MGLPRSENARIDPRKISDYLLWTIHPVGRHKQRFFVPKSTSTHVRVRLIALAGLIIPK